MCGRLNLTASPASIVEHFQLHRQPNFQSSYNIAPAQKILNIVELEYKSRMAVNLFWGLVPSWSKDSKNSSHLINARAETVREKPSFRSAFRHRRSLIPALGFFEWEKLESGKKAFHIHRHDHQLFAFAGLWEPKNPVFLHHHHHGGQRNHGADTRTNACNHNARELPTMAG